jgi:hypothetical protein
MCFTIFFKLEETLTKIKNEKHEKNDYNQFRALTINFEETNETNSVLMNKLDNLQKLKEDELSKNSELELIVNQLKIKLQNQSNRNKELESDLEQNETHKAKMAILEREVKQTIFKKIFFGEIILPINLILQEVLARPSTNHVLASSCKLDV